MANLFQKLELAAFRAGITPRTQESRKWFQQKAGQLRGTSRLELMRQDPLQLRNRHGIGNMYMYFYDPKHKETLPYYDRFPLTIVVEPAKGGFKGINLHYLPNALRAKFLDGLMDITSNKKYDESTKFSLSYKMLKASTNLKYFKPCFKHYLTSNIRSRLALVPAPEWEIATFLPTADFEKAGKGTVYNDSRSMI
jgi:hypothetical protein|tara:strand:- start:2095 stop:2679 length:585 start_codon:yes stop_codon:yes gene_type:complete